MYKKPMECAIEKSIPDAFTFLDGGRVTDAVGWKERAVEISKMYEYYMYGPMPDALYERVSYRLGKWNEKEVMVAFPDSTEKEGRNLSGEKKVTVVVRTARLYIDIECEGRKDGFEAVVCLPVTMAQIDEKGSRSDGNLKREGYPVYLEMSFVWEGRELEPSINDYYAAARGYASICYNPVSVAEDKGGRRGAFYTVHPYGTEWMEQTGVLAAWGWGISKILDALEQGLAEELNVDVKNNMLSGVSRYGKATLVAGAYDKRIKVVVPACSGAGGAAMYRYVSEGNTYDLAEAGYIDGAGNTLYTVTQNEALENLQSEAERHWFNDTFLNFDCVERLPVDQHELVALIADKERYLFMISAVTEEDWVNAAAMGLSYLEACKVFELLGLRHHACLCEHLKGHAVLLSDMEKLLDYCDEVFYSKEEKAVQEVAAKHQTSVFWKTSGETRSIEL